MPRFVPCPGCEQHVKLAESECPHCGARLRDPSGKLLRTATAAVLGLAAATAGMAGCDEPVDEYGPAPTVNSSSASSGGSGGTAGASGVGGAGGDPVAEYGPAPTGAGGGGGVGGAGAGGAGGNG